MAQLGNTTIFGDLLTSGATITQKVTLKNGGDLILQSPPGSSDTGDIVFSDSNGTEIHRLWSGIGTLNYRNTSSGASYAIYHAGNIPTQATRWPTWAEVSGKPSTFAPSTHTHAYANANGRVVTNFNSYLQSGMYGESNAASNNPGNAYKALIVADNLDVGLQITGGYNTDKLWFRGWWSSGAGFSAWREIYHTGNIPTQATRWPTWAEVTSKPDYLARSRWGAAVPSPNAGDMYFT